MKSSKPVKLELPAVAGESLRYGTGQTQLEVKKLNRTEYFAKVVGTQRGRFGNSEQIQEDIHHFFENGVLPRSKTSLS
jgi:hypothetical protein